MILKKIGLRNFRNYEKLDLNLNKKLNIFYGNNAEGKTNILESIYVLGLTKSHRSVKNEELIKFKQPFLRVRGEVLVNNNKTKQEIVITPNEKRVKINGNEERKLSKYISHLNVIIFSPDDLNIVKGSPSGRRKLLNVDIGQIDNRYINILNEYNIVIKMRNEYLRKNRIDENYLDVITSKMIELASKIYVYRKEFIDNINNGIGNIFCDLTDFGNLRIEYITSPVIDDYGNIKDILDKEYRSVKKREINYGKTLFGPQLDDFLFLMDDIDLKLYGSQGQQRSAILAFKFAEIDIFNEKPILLLDDVLSELDRTKKNKLIKYIDRDIQTIITTTNIRNISKKLLKDASIYRVYNNNVEVKVHGK